MNKGSFIKVLLFFYFLFDFKLLNADRNPKYYPINSNPIDLNTSNYDKLFLIPGISAEQVKDIMSHRSKFGDLVSVYELQAIKSFSAEYIKSISPFVFVKELNCCSKNFFTTNSDISLNSGFISLSMNVVDKNFTNFISVFNFKHPLLYDFKFSYTKEPNLCYIKNLSIDQFFNIYKANLLFGSKECHKRIIIGNYQIIYGQGLVTNSDYYLGKYVEVITIAKVGNKGILPYNAVNSIGFFGPAITFDLNKKIALTFYFSQSYLNNEIKENKEFGVFVVESKISRSNVFNNKISKNKEQLLLERVYGFSSIYHIFDDRFIMGINMLGTFFNHNILRKDKSVFNFAGDKNLGMSFFYNITYKNFYFFGEIASSKNLSVQVCNHKSLATAFLNGIIYSINKWNDVSILHRYYSPFYNCFYGRPICENSNIRNEHAVYFGFENSFIKDFTFSFFCDYSQLVQETLKNANGALNWFCRGKYVISKNIQILGQFCQKKKNFNRVESLSKGTHMHVIDVVMNRSKVKYDFQLNEGVKFQTYLFLNKFNDKNSVIKAKYSYGIIQNIVFKLTARNNIFLRLGYANPNKMSGSIFVYEPGFRGRTANYSVVGLIFCVMFRVVIFSKVKLGFKYSDLFQNDVNKNFRCFSIHMKYSF